MSILMNAGPMGGSPVRMRLGAPCQRIQWRLIAIQIKLVRALG